jgi:hypothetical protein
MQNSFTYFVRLRSQLNPLQDASCSKKISINDLVIKVSLLHVSYNPFYRGLGLAVHL